MKIIVTGNNVKVNIVENNTIYDANKKTQDFIRKSKKREKKGKKDRKNTTPKQIHNENIKKWNEKMNLKEKQVQKMYLLSKTIPELKGRYIRMKNCGKYLDFTVCKDCGHWTIQHAQLCRDRLCPVCNWRLSLKRFSAMMKIFDKIDIKNYKSTFLTLTIKNCETGKLSETITQMCKAWDRMLHRKYYKENLCGWARSIEITYNTVTNTWHPHIHCIMLWDNKLSLKNQEDYICSDWQESLRIDYKPVVDNKIIKNLHSENEQETVDETIEAILETSKYSIKDDTLDTLTLSETQELLYAVKNRRLIAFGGIIKEAKKTIDIKIDTTDKEETEEKSVKLDFCTLCKSNDLIEATAAWAFDRRMYNFYIKDGK